MKMRKAVLASLVVACAPVAASATVLYSANFNATTDSTGWTTNVAPTANASTQSAEFGFDYSTFGIPAAPGAVDTLGLRLRANVPGSAAAPVTTRPAGVTSGLSVSPTGQNFGSAYKLTFYAWSNFNGAANASGLADNANSEGGTNNIMMAVGTSGTVPLVVANTSLVTNGAMDGVGFATTGDGGIANDYRVYPKSGTIAPGTSGYYAAGTDATVNQNVNAYYTAIPSLGAHSAPAVQQTLSTAEFADAGGNTQASTQPGAFGFAWHKVEITNSGSTITWDIDGSRIATVDSTTLAPLGGNNIGLGVSDVNSSTTRHPSLLFTVFDNLTVETVPEPTSLGLAAVAGLGLLARRKRRA